MDVLEIMKERHSVRQYKNQAIEPLKREGNRECLFYQRVKEKVTTSGLSVNYKN